MKNINFLKKLKKIFHNSLFSKNLFTQLKSLKLIINIVCYIILLYFI